MRPNGEPQRTLQVRLLPIGEGTIVWGDHPCDAGCAARSISRSAPRRKNSPREERFSSFLIRYPHPPKVVAPLVTLARSAPGSYRETLSRAAMRAAAL